MPLPGKEHTAGLKPPTRTSIYIIGAEFRQRGPAARICGFWRENARKNLFCGGASAAFPVV